MNATSGPYVDTDDVGLRGFAPRVPLQRPIGTPESDAGSYSPGGLCRTPRRMTPRVRVSGEPGMTSAGTAVGATVR